MNKPTGKLKFAYDTIRKLNEESAELKALLYNEESRIERMLSVIDDYVTNSYPPSNECDLVRFNSLQKLLGAAKLEKSDEVNLAAQRAKNKQLIHTNRSLKKKIGQLESELTDRNNANVEISELEKRFRILSKALVAEEQFSRASGDTEGADNLLSILEMKTK